MPSHRLNFGGSNIVNAISPNFVGIDDPPRTRQGYNFLFTNLHPFLMVTHPFASTRATLKLPDGSTRDYFSLPELARAGHPKLSRLPVSLRIVLESLLRNCDGKRVSERDVRALAAWKPKANRTEEIPFVVARIVLQDFTGVPLLVDLAAMRAAVARAKRDPKLIEPLVPVDLVVDVSPDFNVSSAFTPVTNSLSLPRLK